MGGVLYNCGYYRSVWPAALAKKCFQTRLLFFCRFLACLTYLQAKGIKTCLVCKNLGTIATKQKQKLRQSMLLT